MKNIVIAAGYATRLGERNQRVHSPQGPLNVVDSCHDSAKQASLMALTAPRVHRGMQHEKLQKPTTFLRFGKPGHGLNDLKLKII